MTTTQFFVARKQTGKKAWPEVLTWKEGDLIEFELAFEDAGLRTVHLAGGRVNSVSPPTANGQTMNIIFIGSDDPEIVAEFPAGSEVDVHLDSMTARQTASKVTSAGLLHSEKFRRVSLNDFRAISYLSRVFSESSVLPQHRPKHRACELRCRRKLRAIRRRLLEIEKRARERCRHAMRPHGKTVF